MPHRKTYIIFVVDSVEDNLARFAEFFSQREYLVYYCKTAAEARAILAGVSADIIITNIRLSDLAGQEFLIEAHQHCPYAIRMVLGDEAERSDLLKLVAGGVAHRFFCTPWDRNNILEILNQDLETRSLMRSRKCWQFLERSANLPLLPPLVRDIEHALMEPDYDINRVITLIERDPVLASRLLHVVNSAAFTRGSTIGDVRYAVLFVGMEQIKEILLFFCAIKSLPPSPSCRKQAVMIAEHSFRSARLAGHIAETMLPGEQREAATAALLHDIGRLVFYSVEGEQYFGLEQSGVVRTRHAPSIEEEHQKFGINHAELGSSLLLWWNLPMTIVEAAARHCQPLYELVGIPKCVAIADRCLLEAASGYAVSTDLDAMNPDLPIEDWRRTARELLADRSISF